MSRGTIARIVDRIDLLVAWIGNLISWLALALVVLVAANVLARYLLSAGTVALQELEWHLMAVLALVGLSYGINRGEQVRVDMLYARFSLRTKAIVDAASAIMMTAIALIMIKLSIGYFGQSFALKEGSPDPGGLPYRFLLKSLLPFGFALLAAQGVVELGKAIRKLGFAGNVHREGEPSGTSHGE